MRRITWKRPGFATKLAAARFAGEVVGASTPVELGREARRQEPAAGDGIAQETAPPRRRALELVQGEAAREPCRPRRSRDTGARRSAEPSRSGATGSQSAPLHVEQRPLGIDDRSQRDRDRFSREPRRRRRRSRSPETDRPCRVASWTARAAEPAPVESVSVARAIRHEQDQPAPHHARAAFAVARRGVRAWSRVRRGSSARILRCWAVAHQRAQDRGADPPIPMAPRRTPPPPHSRSPLQESVHAFAVDLRVPSAGVVAAGRAGRDHGCGRRPGPGNARASGHRRGRDRGVSDRRRPDPGAEVPHGGVRLASDYLFLGRDLSGGRAVAQPWVRVDHERFSGLLWADQPDGRDVPDEMRMSFSTRSRSRASPPSPATPTGASLTGAAGSPPRRCSRPWAPGPCRWRRRCLGPLRLRRRSRPLRGPRALPVAGATARGRHPRLRREVVLRRHRHPGDRALRSLNPAVRRPRGLARPVAHRDLEPRRLSRGPGGRGPLAARPRRLSLTRPDAIRSEPTEIRARSFSCQPGHARHWSEALGLHSRRS